jgi:hypothetical protein
MMKNVYLGSSQKMRREEAQEKAKALKREALEGHAASTRMGELEKLNQSMDAALERR